MMLFMMFLLSCNQSREDLLIGDWQPIEETDSLKPKRNIIMRFKKGGNMELMVAETANEFITHEGTYKITEDGKILEVYREGRQENKNRAEIVALDENRLSLVNLDQFVKSDTLHLKRIK